MVRHVVMWRLHENNHENRLEISRLLRELPDRINDIETLEVGSNFNRGEFAYDMVLITTHRDITAMENYKKHPEHIIVADRIKKLTTERAVVDFEF